MTMMQEPNETQREYLRRAYDLATVKYGDKEEADEFMNNPHPTSLGSDLSPRELILLSDQDAHRVLNYLICTQAPHA